MTRKTKHAQTQIQSVTDIERISMISLMHCDMNFKGRSSREGGIKSISNTCIHCSHLGYSPSSWRCFTLSPPLRASNWRLCDEFCDAGGQRLKVRGTPAGSQGCSGLQWGGILWLVRKGGGWRCFSLCFVWCTPPSSLSFPFSDGMNHCSNIR